MCKQVKLPHSHLLGLLQPLHIPEVIWSEIIVDFVIGLLVVCDHSVIIIVVDRLSKYCHLGSLPPMYLAFSIADYFIHNII